MPSQGKVVFHLNVDLTTTQREVLPINPQRKYALLVNSSDADCYISLGIPAVASQGILLKSGGGSYEINNTNLFDGRIYAVSTGTTKRLSVTEY